MEHKRVKKPWTKPVLCKIDLDPELRRRLLDGRKATPGAQTKQR